MIGDSIRSLIKADPFRPFVMKCEDGRTFRVMGRELILISPNGNVVDLFQPDGEHDIFQSEIVTEVSVMADEVTISDPVIVE